MTKLIIVLLLSALHLLAGHLKFISIIPRSIWLSIGGGVSIAYIFLHLLPELGRGKEVWEDGPVFLLALVGLVVFYGLEKYAKTQITGKSAENKAFWVHIGSYLVYNSIIGYILIVEFHHFEMYLFALAMAFHFVVNDYGLRHHHQKEYDRIGKWLVSAGILAGAALALWMTLPPWLLVAATSFIGGSVILNTLKEELPEERKSKYWAFLLGVVLYSAILLILEEVGSKN